MSRTLARLFRVDNVPLWLWPLFGVYTVGLAIPYLAYVLLIRLTARVEWVGNRTWLQPPAIHTWWHRYANVYFPVFLPLHRHVFMTHPDWYMAPTHLLFKLLGVKKIFLGSTGHDGKAAAERVVAALRSGSLTVMTPDGPEGPPGEIHRGVYFMAEQSGASIVPIRFEVQGKFRLWGWDHKWVPLPFCRIRVIISSPLSPPKTSPVGDWGAWDLQLRKDLGPWG